MQNNEINLCVNCIYYTDREFFAPTCTRLYSEETKINPVSGKKSRKYRLCKHEREETGLCKENGIFFVPIKSKLARFRRKDYFPQVIATAITLFLLSILIILSNK